MYIGIEVSAPLSCSYRVYCHSYDKIHYFIYIYIFNRGEVWCGSSHHAPQHRIGLIFTPTSTSFTATSSKQKINWDSRITSSTGTCNLKENMIKRKGETPWRKPRTHQKGDPLDYSTISKIHLYLSTPLGKQKASYYLFVFKLPKQGI